MFEFPTPTLLSLAYLMLSDRGKKLLVVEEFKFCKDKETLLFVSYRCTKQGCSAFISGINQ